MGGGRGGVGASGSVLIGVGRRVVGGCRWGRWGSGEWVDIISTETGRRGGVSTPRAEGGGDGRGRGWQWSRCSPLGRQCRALLAALTLLHLRRFGGRVGITPCLLGTRFHHVDVTSSGQPKVLPVDPRLNDLNHLALGDAPLGRRRICRSGENEV